MLSSYKRTPKNENALNLYSVSLEAFAMYVIHTVYWESVAKWVYKMVRAYMCIRLRVIIRKYLFCRSSH